MFLWFKVKRSFWEVCLDGRCPVPPYDLVHILTYSNSSFPSCPWLMAKEGHRTYAHSLYMLPMNVSSKRSSFLCWKRHLKILNSKRPREFQQCGSIHILKTFLFQLCYSLVEVLLLFTLILFQWHGFLTLSWCSLKSWVFISVKRLFRLHQIVWVFNASGCIKEYESLMFKFWIQLLQTHEIIDFTTLVKCW